MKTPGKFYGWKMVAIVWAQYFLHMGLGLYGSSVIGSVMLDAGAMSRGVHGLTFTLFSLFIGTTAIVVAQFVARFGVKRTFITGSLIIMAASLFLCFFASRPWHFLLVLGVLMGAGVAFGSVVPLSTTISRWFTRLRGKALAAALTASALAGLVFAPLINFVIETLGFTWRQAWLCVAALMLIPITLALLFIREFPGDIGQEPDGGAGAGAQQAARSDSRNDARSDALRTAYDWTPPEVYRTAAFWQLVLAACVTQFAFVFFSTQWIRAMRSFDFSPANAAFGVSVFTIMSLPARLVSGVLLDRIRPKFVFLMGFACTAVSFATAVFIARGGLAFAYLAATFGAFGFGLSYVSYQTAAMQFFGANAFTKINGTLLMTTAIVTAPASMIVSAIYGAAGSFVPVFFLNIAVAVLGLVSALFLKMPQPVTKNPCRN